MKNIFTSILSVFIITAGFSQSQRMVLIEEASNASCGPCAAQNPAFHALTEANTTKVVTLKYQWYFPGFDPMNVHNPTEVATRFETYYGQSGVPTAMLDGSIPETGDIGFDPTAQGWYAGAPGGFSQALIDNRYAVPASFDINVTYTLTPDNISVTATANCTQAVSGNLKMRIAVIEKEIVFDTAPGSNGETAFYHVMKKFLPNAGGVAMAGTYASGESFTTTQAWNLANIYDYNEIAVVVFIQDDATKEVHQVKLADGVQITPSSTLDVAALSSSGIDPFVCGETITPSVTIRNNGSEVLTSLNVNYDVNGSTGTIPWTGSLGFYEEAVCNLGTVAFTPGSQNTITITTSNPNGATDLNISNDEIEVDFAIAAYASTEIKVIVRTDYYPGETSWEIRNSNNALIASHAYVPGTADQFGGGGADATIEHTHDVVLNVNDCYAFKLLDSFGDGMGYTGGSTTATPFGYKIENASGVVITSLLANSLDFGDETVNKLRTDASSSINNEASMNNVIRVYPNPSSSQTSLSIKSANPANASLQIFNALGQKLEFRSFGKVSGEQTFSVDVNHLPSGLYFFAVTVGEKTTSQKVTIAR